MTTSINIETDWKTIFQGAEAHVAYNYVLNRRVIKKLRCSKGYRNIELDVQLNNHRFRSECTNMQKARRSGVLCPGIISVDKSSLTIYQEYINGPTVQEIMDGFPISIEATKVICLNIGKILNKLHMSGIIHGDLTMSNMKLRPCCDCRSNNDDKHREAVYQCIKEGTMDNVICPESNKPVLVQLYLLDFGLSATTSTAEDRSVDIYVLERGLTSTVRDIAAQMATWILEGYSSSGIVFRKDEKSGKENIIFENNDVTKDIKDIINRLLKVRIRGRKREEEF